ncbi:MAG: hypothetical protein M1381_12295 [Deltaproteobacteria bacterium]|nr:hypothetical protein [Deltaproteobacteria bacterium]MCL5792407.1 hypothetical protein [Deltaproteobacteria bacterium]
MVKKTLVVLGIMVLVGFQLTGCGKQTVGESSAQIAQTTEESISGASNDSIALSNVSNSQLGIADYGLSVVASACPNVTKPVVTNTMNSTTWTLDINFGNGCIPNYFTNIMTSGNITMTVTRFTDGTNVTATTIDTNGDIERTRWDGASLYISGTTDIVRTGTVSQTSTTRTRAITVNETRVAISPRGKVVMNHNLSLNFNAADTLSSSTPSTIIQRVLNGTGSVDHLLAKVLAGITVTNLTYEQGYCHPVDGTVILVLTKDTDGSPIGTYTLVFSHSSATLNGNPITLNPCD